MRRRVDGEEVRKRLEAEFGVTLPKFRCHGGWEVPIRQILQEAKARDLLERLGFLEIKEKFGGLRVYTTPPDGKEEDWQKFNRKVRKIEATSLEICEECGEPGTGTWDGGLFLTLCGGCKAERGL
jgi:hypothetical protein